MNKYFLLFITLTFIFLKTTKSQVSINIGGQFANPQFLVENVLIGGGVTASNFSYMGDSIQIGTFNGNASNLGISSGVVIGTGDVRALTPNNSNLAPNVTVMPPVQDPDLLAVANSVPGLIGQNFVVNSINDVAVLEFDFVAFSDTLSFDFVFGSREYFGFENSGFNDVFGFFISGPGITGPYSSPPGFPNGSANIAVVPQSSPELPITVSSVNANLNSNFFVDNQGVQTIADADGFTIPLEARALVQCGELYHIRLAIADGSDSGLSSYVFLSANSFSSPEVLVSNDNTNGELTELLIPCESTVNLSAQLPNLEDYQFNWNTGATTQNIDVMAGDYWVTLVNNQNCLFSSDTIKVRNNQPPIFALEDNLRACSGDNTLLKIDTIYGFPPYFYSWSNGWNNETIEVLPGNYHLTVTDSNNCSFTDSVTIALVTRPTAFISGEAAKCFNSEAVLELDFQFTGEPPFIVNYGLEENQFIDTINSFSYLKDVVDIGVYSIFQLNDNFCSGNFDGVGNFKEFSNFTSYIAGGENICIGEETVLEISVDGINPPYDIVLNNNSYNTVFKDVTSNPFQISVSDTALYKVAYVEDINGCRSEINNGSAYVAYKTLNEPNILAPVQTVFCQVDSAIQLFSDLEGGTWSGKGVTREGVFVPVNAVDGEGFVYYTYPESCNEGDSVLLTVGCDYGLFSPTGFTPNEDGINDNFKIEGYNILEFNLDVFDRWGGLLYSTNDMSLFWDGTFKGALVPTGDYIYNINFYAKDAKFYKKSGTVSVIY